MLLRAFRQNILLIAAVVTATMAFGQSNFPRKGEESKPMILAVQTGTKAKKKSPPKSPPNKKSSTGVSKQESKVGKSKAALKATKKSMSWMVWSVFLIALGGVAAIGLALLRRRKSSNSSIAGSFRLNEPLMQGGALQRLQSQFSGQAPADQDVAPSGIQQKLSPNMKANAQNNMQLSSSLAESPTSVTEVPQPFYKEAFADSNDTLARRDRTDSGQKPSGVRGIGVVADVMRGEPVVDVESTLEVLKRVSEVAQVQRPAQFGELPDTKSRSGANAASTKKKGA